MSNPINESNIMDNNNTEIDMSNQHDQFNVQFII